MQRRVIAILLMILLALTAGCSGVSQPQSQIPHDSEVVPSAPEPSVNTSNIPENSEVFADFSYLPNTQLSFSPVGSRLSDEPLDKLTPSDNYGRLIPYRGSYLYTKYSSYIVGYTYGLTTMDGEVVMDPVCSNIWIASYYEPNQQYAKNFDIYVLQKVPDDIGEDESEVRMEYAIAAIDGSWATDFDYCDVLCTDQGIFCILDWESNSAIYFDENGNEILDTRNLPIYNELAPYGLYYANTGSDGWFPMQINDGSMVLCSIDGQIIRPQDGTWINIGCFSEGLAPVYDGSLYGYIDRSGQWVIEPQFTYAGNFTNGIALITGDANSNGKAIDKSGNVVFEFVDSWPSFQDINGVSYYTDYQYNPDDPYPYQSIYYTTDFERILLDGENPSASLDIFWINKDNGVLLRLPDGKELFVEDAISVLGGCPDNYFTVQYSDDTFAVFNDNGESIFTTDEYLNFVTDSITGEAYIFVPISSSYNYNYNIYSLSGELLLTGVTELSVENGLFLCSDAVSIGIKNIENEWVLRLKLDTE